MKSRKGFTLIELMVVILIVGILAAVAIPLMRGRIDSAKWTEGKAAMGTIATGLRAYCAEQGGDLTGLGAAPVTGADAFTDMGIEDEDLNGTIFVATDYSITALGYNAAASPSLTFTIEGTCASESLTPDTVTLTQDGVWAYP